MQFYPGDWMKDPNLRRCSHAAKGVWIDILCLMWESEERGVLVTSQRAWSDEEIALAVGGDNATTLACLAELTLKGVANRRQDGALYSKRMVRDEHKRTLCKEAGKRGGNPMLVGESSPTLKGVSKGAPKGRSKGELTPSSSVSVSSSDNSLSLSGKTRSLKVPPEWDCQEFWEAIVSWREHWFRRTGHALPDSTLHTQLMLIAGNQWPVGKVCRSILTAVAVDSKRFFDPDETRQPSPHSVQAKRKHKTVEEVFGGD
jgi:hypothetical protein